VVDPTIQASTKDPLRRRAVAVSVASVFALAIAAAAIGWLIGSSSPEGEPKAHTSTTASPSGSTPTSSNTPTADKTSSSPLGTPTDTPSRGGLPDYAGRPFVDVFRELRLMKLGVRVVFEGTEDDPAVDRTEPGPGAVVLSGSNVTIYVKGGPAFTTVPNLIGLSCGSGTGTAGNVLYESGLSPHYGIGREGVVVAQAPLPTSLTTRWNDTVEVTCGSASPVATLTPSG